MREQMSRWGMIGRTFSQILASKIKAISVLCCLTPAGHLGTYRWTDTATLYMLLLCSYVVANIGQTHTASLMLQYCGAMRLRQTQPISVHCCLTPAGHLGTDGQTHPLSIHCCCTAMSYVPTVTAPPYLFLKIMKINSAFRKYG